MLMGGSMTFPTNSGLMENGNDWSGKWCWKSSTETVRAGLPQGTGRISYGNAQVFNDLRSNPNHTQGVALQT